MPNIEKAVHLLQPGETAFAVLTNGLDLSLEENGNGTSGYWRLDAKRASKVQKVIIYKRNDEIKPARSDIYIANFVRLTPAEPADQAGRFVIHMSGAKPAGVTKANWKEFADAGQNPIRYVGA